METFKEHKQLQLQNAFALVLLIEQFIASGVPIMHTATVGEH